MRGEVPATAGRDDRPDAGVPWLTPAEQRAWRAFLAVDRLLMDALDDDLRAYGLQLTEYEILVMLSEATEGHLRMSALAEKVVQSRSRLTHTASRMERRGLVQRRPSPDDRRGVELWLTDRGHDLLERLAPVHVESVRRHFIDHLGSAEFVRVGEALDAVRHGLLHPRPDPGPAAPGP